MTPEYLLTVLIVCVSPGIGVTYTLAVTLGGGVWRGLLAALGCTLCTMIHLGLAMAGLAAILHASAVLFQTVKWLGVAYLLWMAWGVLRETGGLSLRPERAAAPGQVVWRGIVVNLLNPKLPLFFAAFLPQFVPADAPDATARLVELGAVFVVATFVTFALYALFAGALRARLLGSAGAMAWLRRVFAASFAALGARLALERV